VSEGLAWRLANVCLVLIVPEAVIGAVQWVIARDPDRKWHLRAVRHSDHGAYDFARSISALRFLHNCLLRDLDSQASHEARVRDCSDYRSGRGNCAPDLVRYGVDAGTCGYGGQT
jgi:hypothetical protein